jgi:hypothetical protein
VIPGLRESFYGKLAVNLGVLLPCVYRIEDQQKPPAFVHDYHCTVRERLGRLAFGEDQWFELVDDTPELATTVVGLIDRFGLPFLEQFGSYSDVLTYFQEHGRLPFQTDGRACLEAAVVAHEIGEEDLSRGLLEKAWSIATDHKGFQEHVVEIAGRIGYTIGQQLGPGNAR